MKFKDDAFGERIAKFKDFDGDELQVKAHPYTVVFRVFGAGEAIGRAVAMEPKKARKLAKAILQEYGE